MDSSPHPFKRGPGRPSSRSRCVVCQRPESDPVHDWQAERAPVVACVDGSRRRPRAEPCRAQAGARLLTIKEVADRLGLPTREGVYTLRDLGLLPVRYLSTRRPRILEADLLQFLDNLPTSPPE